MSEFEITHILFSSLKLRHFIWIDESSFPVIPLFDFISQRRSPILAKKKPNVFQVIAFCFKGNNKSCYVTHVNFSSSTLFKDIWKCFMLTPYISILQNRFPFLFWFRWYQWYFCGINGCEDTNRNVCLYTSFSEGISLPCATSNSYVTRETRTLISQRNVY